MLQHAQLENGRTLIMVLESARLVMINALSVMVPLTPNVVNAKTEIINLGPHVLLVIRNVYCVMVPVILNVVNAHLVIS